MAPRSSGRTTTEDIEDILLAIFFVVDAADVEVAFGVFNFCWGLVIFLLGVVFEAGVAF